MDTEGGVISDEIDFWLDLSAIFFEIFQIKQDQGPTWYLVHELLKYPNGTCSVGDAASALQARAVARSKATSDVSKYSRYLRKLELLKIENIPGAGRVYPVSVRISATEKMKNNVARYVRDVLRRLFDASVSEKCAEPIPIMNEIYDFMTDTYIPKWESFLTQIARIAIKGKTGTETPILNELRGSSEYFVLLLKLWERYLNGDYKLGFTAKELQNVHPRIMVMTPNDMLRHTEYLRNIEFLHEIGKDENGNVRFVYAEKFNSAFERYEPAFVKMRGLFRDRLQITLSS